MSTSMASDTYHEPLELLSEHTRDLHRAITSLMEELEAIDWYQQRSEATQDEDLRAILEHNRDEETEHAMMVLEWLRRKSPVFNEHVRTYLLKEGPITGLEAAQKEGKGETATEGGPKPKGGSSPSPSAGGSKGGGRGELSSLGIGSLKGK